MRDRIDLVEIDGYLMAIAIQAPVDDFDGWAAAVDAMLETLALG